VAPQSAKPGGKITISGQFFTGVWSVKIGGQAATFTVVSPGTISATVPKKAKRGTLPLDVTSATGTASIQLAVGVASHQTAPLHVSGTAITVTAGKPSELAFNLSKTSKVAAGTITFKVTNAGKVTHDFKICTTPVTSFKANSCTGKVTKMLAPGQTTTLTVKLTKSGTYEYLCTVPGHAAAGMKGLIGIGAAAGAAPAPKPTSPGATTTPPKTTTTPGATCAHPANTTVNVDEFDYGFTLSQNSIPCGSVTFVQKNTGATQHNFDLTGVPAGAGAGGYINPGQSTTMTVTLGPGSWGYQCDVPTHAGLGMIGQLTVTG
jgi:uncharacterized protein (TIGR03437 family)